MLRLFSCIQIIKGFSRSLIQDLNRGKVHTIPNDMHDLLENKKLTNDQVELIKERENGKEYLNFLFDNELVFHHDECFEHCFPNISLEYKSPFVIEYLYIDRNWIVENKCFFDIINKTSIQRLIIVIDKIDINIIKEEIQYFESLTDIDFVFKSKNCPGQELENIDSLIGKSKCIGLVLDNIENGYSETEYRTIFVTSNKKFDIWSNNNISNFSKNSNYYPGTYKTMYINSNGFIFNTMSSNKKIGNTSEVKNSERLIDIMGLISKEEYYNITKENVEVCSDCEFRFLCIDKNIPLKRKTGEWYHDEECEYNPYINKLRGEKGYRTLFESGVRSNEDQFEIDFDQLELVNKKLWGRFVDDIV